MYALVVFALCVDDVHGLFAVHQHATIAHLSAHLAIKWRVVEHQLKVSVLLLRNLAVAKYATFVLGIIVTHEVLFAFAQHNPIGIFHRSGISCTFFLLLHLHVKLGGVYLQPIFAADKLCKVERKAVSVEQTEGLRAVERGFSLGFQAVHLIVQHRDALFKCT